MARSIIQSAPGPIFPGGEQTPRGRFLGYKVPGGAAGGVLFLNRNGNVAINVEALHYDEQWGALEVWALDLSKYKAVTAGQRTSSTNDSYSTFSSVRICQGSVATGFGAGYSVSIGENGGDPVQAGAWTTEYDGRDGSGVANRWAYVIRTAWNGDNSPVVKLTARGDMVWTPKSGSGAYGSALNVVSSAAVTSPVNGAIILDGTTVKVYASGSWRSLAASPLTTKGDIWVYGSADTRQAVGADGTILTADSTQPNGMRWAAASATVPYWRVKQMLKSVATGTVVDSPYFDDPNLYAAVVATGPEYCWGPDGGFQRNGYGPEYCVWAKMGVTCASGVTMNVTLLCGDDQAGMWVQEPDARTGTILSVNTGTGAVVGNGTQFLTEYAVNDCMKFADGQINYITAIADNTHLTIQTLGQDAVYTVGQAHYRCRKVVDRKTGTPSTTDTGSYTFSAGKSYVIHIFAHNNTTQLSWNFFTDVLSLSGVSWFDPGV